MDPIDSSIIVWRTSARWMKIAKFDRTKISRFHKRKVCEHFRRLARKIQKIIIVCICVLNKQTESSTLPLDDQTTRLFSSQTRSEIVSVASPKSILSRREIAFSTFPTPGLAKPPCARGKRADSNFPPRQFPHGRGKTPTLRRIAQRQNCAVISAAAAAHVLARTATYRKNRKNSRAPHPLSGSGWPGAHNAPRRTFSGGRAPRPNRNGSLSQRARCDFSCSF